MRIMLHTSEQGCKNQNHAAEREIGRLAKRWRLQMTRKRVPKHLWDFGLVYESELLSGMARGSDRRTGYEEVTGQTPDTLMSGWILNFMILCGGWIVQSNQMSQITHVDWLIGSVCLTGSDQTFAIGS
jgi:hypothetical protein